MICGNAIHLSVKAKVSPRCGMLTGYNIRVQRLAKRVIEGGLAAKIVISKAIQKFLEETNVLCK